jgi:hypothetical protein
MWKFWLVVGTVGLALAGLLRLTLYRPPVEMREFRTKSKTLQGLAITRQDTEPGKLVMDLLLVLDLQGRARSPLNFLAK